MYYNSNYGLGGDNAWQNVSKGLPLVPVIKLLYIEGSDDVMFAATDIGVYRWNKAAAQWECFQEGLPRGMVTDIEMNYCSGKLRVTLFGRGIWESDIQANVADRIPGVSDIINSNTTWSQSKTIDGSILVKSGTTLEISGSRTRIYMPRNGKIMVEHNAKVIVDGATITNECGFGWKGIELKGYPGSDPVPAYQGSLELKNNATLENAAVGVRNFCPDLNGFNGGGIIKAEQATFRNCWRAVELNDYATKSYKYGGVSRCSFKNVTFTINDATPFSKTGVLFSSWNTLNGVQIDNCTFSNTTTGVALHQRGEAIRTGLTGMDISNSAFDGFFSGIYSEGTMGSVLRRINIHDNEFTKTTENIKLAGTDYSSIKGNSITQMTSLNSDPPYALGIYLDQVRGAYVGCQNVIEGDYLYPLWGGGNTGIIVKHSYKHATSVTDNSLKGLRRGLQVQWHNPNLDILCNSFSSSDFGIVANPQSNMQGLKDQGNGCGNGEYRAGNKFIGVNYGIMSYLQQSWRYYAGTGANESPWWWGLMTFTSCTTAARCSRELTCIRVLSPQDRAELEREFGELGKIGEKHSPEGRILLAEIIKAYNDDDNTTGLRAFLEAEQANPEAKKLLVPLYIDMGLYTEAEELIDTLNIDLPAWDDYRNFYTIMMDLKRNNRRHDSLTVPESLVMLDLAADTTSELNGYAKSLLDWFGIVPWEHDIEEIPVEEISRKIKFPALNNNPASQLLEATPNPSADYAEIRIIVAQQDENRHPALVVRNSTGAAVFSESLKPGEQKVRVNTAGWSPGLYFYSLVCGEKVLDTKKLSVVKQ